MCLNSFLVPSFIVAAIICAGGIASEPAELNSGVDSSSGNLNGGHENEELLAFARNHPQLHDVDEHDPAYAVIKPFVSSVQQRYAEDPVWGVMVDYVKEVRGPASRQLFPHFRFFVCRWTEKMKASPPEGSPQKSGGTYVETVALNENLDLISIGPGPRHAQTFGEFLAAQKVRVTDEKSARLVWDAYCEVRRWLFPGGKTERVSDRLWRLGVRDHRGRGKAYYEVRLNENLTVKSAERIIEDADGRRWK